MKRIQIQSTKVLVQIDNAPSKEFLIPALYVHVNDGEDQWERDKTDKYIDAYFERVKRITKELAK